MNINQLRKQMNRTRVHEAAGYDVAQTKALLDKARVPLTGLGDVGAALEQVARAGASPAAQKKARAWRNTIDKVVDEIQSFLHSNPNLE